MVSRRAAVLTSFLCIVPALNATAQIPLGSEFRVDSTGADRGFMNDTPRNVSMAADGSFVVAWLTPPSAPGSFDNDIAARRFNAAGRASGPDFIVNSYTTGFQENESIASDDAGNFVVVWDGIGSDGLWHVFGQRFDAAGVRRGAEFPVDATTASNAFQPFVAMRPGGEFVVAWAADNAFVRARRYDASGVPVGGDFQVNTDTSVDPSGVSLDFDGAGNFVVVWGERYPSYYHAVRARLFTGAGAPQGPEFVVNATTTNSNVRPRVARSPDGSFVVAWSAGQTVAARQFDPSGAPLGADIAVGPMVAGFYNPSLDVDADADGDFVIVWEHNYEIVGRRFDSAGSGGPQFRVDTATAGALRPSVANDPAGNFVVAWRAGLTSWPLVAVMARRYAGGLMGTALSVDGSAGPTSDGNGVLEAGETMAVAPSWLNANFTAQTFTGTAASFTGPGTAGDPTYAIADGAASYGTVASGATESCATAGDCYVVGISNPATRPAIHWDATFREEIAPANLGAAKNWTLHVGDSFADVPRSNAFYRFVETILHHNVTAGCATANYCPASSSTREQMAVFVLVAKEGSGSAPPACTTPMFNDVPASSPFCRWIEELARRGVVTGCGGGSYCATAAVSRQEMAVFVLATKEPGVTPPACGVPMFNDVPASSPFCPWIEELARRGVVTGCGSGAYCPTAPVTREQMGVFLSAGFGLLLYGPS